MLRGEESIQDPVEVCSENEGKPLIPALAEQKEVLQGEMRKGQWESRCAVKVPDTWHSLSLLQEMFFSFRTMLSACSLISRCPDDHCL